MAESWTCPRPAYIPHSACQSPSCPVMVPPSRQPALDDVRKALRWRNGTSAACSTGPITLALTWTGVPISAPASMLSAQHQRNVVPPMQHSP